MKPFRERNPVPIGAIGIAILAVLLAFAFNVERLPLIGGGDLYYANFSEAGGLQPRDQVRVAGVEVGQVQSVELDGSHVRVGFRVDGGVEFGNQSSLRIKIATVLGERYLALEPKGQSTLAPGASIPLSRTETPFNVIEAFSGLTERTQQIDTERLAKSFETLSATFRDSPEEVQASLRGLTRLSKTISSRNEKLNELLSYSENVTKVLSERNREFVTLLQDADKLLQELDRRREVIHKLLVNTVELSNQLTALVEENQRELEPALQRLNDVVDILRRNKQQLQRGMQLLAPFVREFTDTLGTGPWFDVYLQNIAPVPPSVQPPGN